jgi:teichuronic acid biosynthesis glycosyltransferase TuaC
VASNFKYMSNLKILVLSGLYPNESNPHFGIFVHNQARYLSKAGCHVKVISPTPLAPKLLQFRPKWKNYGEIPEAAVIDGIEVFYPRYVRPPGAWFHALSCYTMFAGIDRMVKFAIEEFRPNVLHAHRATPEGFVGQLIAKKFDIPLVCSLRGSDINVFPYRDRLTMSLTRKVLSSGHRLISVSGTLKAVAESISSPLKPIRVIYNGCTTDNFYFDGSWRHTRRATLGIDSEAKVLIFVGNLIKAKGVFELLSSFTKLASSRPNLYLIMVGTGSEQKKIENLIASATLDKRILLTGKVPHSEVSSLLSAADIFVFPTHNEGLPNALLEAMACGLPIVATRAGGIPEVVTDRKSGILINPQDCNSLSNTIEYLLDHEAVARQMGAAGKQYVEANFSWEHNARETIEIYREVLANERQGF